MNLPFSLSLILVLIMMIALSVHQEAGIFSSLFSQSVKTRVEETVSFMTTSLIETRSNASLSSLSSLSSNVGPPSSISDNSDGIQQMEPQKEQVATSFLTAVPTLSSTAAPTYTPTLSPTAVEKQQQQQQSPLKFEWAAIPFSSLEIYFTKDELTSLGFNHTYHHDQQHQIHEKVMELDTLRAWEREDYSPETTKIFAETPVCKGALPAACCMGSKSDGGAVLWGIDKGWCVPQRTNYFQRYVPVYEEEGEHVDMPLRRLYTMADVLPLLQGRTLALIGDSLMAQVAEAAECSWLRNDPLPKLVAASGLVHPLTKKGAIMQEEDTSIIEQGNDERRDNNSTATGKIKTLNMTREEIKAPEGSKWDSWLHVVVKTSWTVEVPTLATSSSTPSLSKVFFYRAYRPNEDMSNMNGMLEAGEVVMVNFGLHYRNTLQYQIQMSDVLKVMLPHAQRKVMLWRETTAQHHNSIGGEFDAAYYPESNLTREAFAEEEKRCRPIFFTKLETQRQWRDKTVVATARELGFHPIRLDLDYQGKGLLLDESDRSMLVDKETPILFILPFNELTEGLWDMHDSGLGGCEATHFCNTPYVWEHLYDRLYRAIEVWQKAGRWEGGQHI